MFLPKLSVTLYFLLITISPITAHVELLNPNGGETYNPGQIIQIEWQEVLRHDFLNWDILFSPDGGVSWDTVKSNIPLATMNYSWELPYINTSEGRIKIVQDNVEVDYIDSSEDFVISSVTGINHPGIYEENKIYPNPITDYSSIVFDNPGNNSYTLTVYNSRGQLIMTLQDIITNRIHLQLNDFSKGIYFYRLNSNTELHFRGNFMVR